MSLRRFVLFIILLLILTSCASGKEVADGIDEPQDKEDGYEINPTEITPFDIYDFFPKYAIDNSNIEILISEPVQITGKNPKEQLIIFNSASDSHEDFVDTNLAIFQYSTDSQKWLPIYSEFIITDSIESPTDHLHEVHFSKFIPNSIKEQILITTRLGFNGKIGDLVIYGKGMNGNVEELYSEGYSSGPIKIKDGNIYVLENINHGNYIEIVLHRVYWDQDQFVDVVLDSFEVSWQEALKITIDDLLASNDTFNRPKIPLTKLDIDLDSEFIRLAKQGKLKGMSFGIGTKVSEIMLVEGDFLEGGGWNGANYIGYEKHAYIYHDPENHMLMYPGSEVTEDTVIGIMRYIPAMSEQDIIEKLGEPDSADYFEYNDAYSVTYTYGRYYLEFEGENESNLSLIRLLKTWVD
ncbi:hypothetical protein BEP19_16705 [Ammoniphilus oxalaticus]|uniref:DUF4309 domain-containing protein n=1 Tax=Ammoniphilus oxalaticus TaxID=66863 RepID=A0A419SQ17_9BACL|nr:hypothetical protein [Ammoniphilus oxalaticus]RKD26478.1 hypothetical protein BEP19_16705 [Ammoniphilus oxalaticus]